ncbi:MAG: polyphosphate polymerase domain-containing protein [Eubacterium sp.]|nr:polyphosphate polymerase domain-containing protein [Eubacterium sp.]
MKFRNEVKHYINFSQAFYLRQRLKHIMEIDSHAGKNGIYTIKSLYFDNYNDKALREKEDGLNRREKFRIRYYNNDTEFIKVEKKSKIDGLCLKQSDFVYDDDVYRLINGDYSVFGEYESEVIYELYAKMQYQLLRPKNIVIYEREPFVYKQGNVRVTIDSNIRGSTDISAFLDDEIPAVNIFCCSILEVKWDEYLPQVVRDIIQVRNVKASSFSKYAATRFV